MLGVWNKVAETVYKVVPFSFYINPIAPLPLLKYTPGVLTKLPFIMIFELVFNYPDESTLKSIVLLLAKLKRLNAGPVL